MSCLSCKWVRNAEDVPDKRKRSPPAGGGSAGVAVGSLTFLLEVDDSIGSRHLLPVLFSSGFSSLR